MLLRLARSLAVDRRDTNADTAPSTTRRRRCGNGGSRRVADVTIEETTIDPDAVAAQRCGPGRRHVRQRRTRSLVPARCRGSRSTLRSARATPTSYAFAARSRPCATSLRRLGARRGRCRRRRSPGRSRSRCRRSRRSRVARRRGPSFRDRATPDGCRPHGPSQAARYRSWFPNKSRPGTGRFHRQ